MQTKALSRVSHLALAALLSAPLAAQDCGITLDLNPAPKAPLSGIHHGYVDLPDGFIPKPPPPQPRPFVEAGGTHFLSGTTSQLGEAPYATTGLPNGTTLLGDVLPNAFAKNPFNDEQIAHFTPFQGGVAFIASDGELRTLYHYNTTSHALIKLADIGLEHPEHEDARMVVVGGKLLFQIFTFLNASLWSSDGTPAGTMEVLQLGFGGEVGPMRQLHATPNGLGAYFFNYGDALPRGVYRTDGTAAGTVQIFGSLGTEEPQPNEDWIAFLGNDAIISLRHANLGYQLYRSNGTAAGTQLLKDFSSQSPGLSADLDHAAEWNGKLYFNGQVSLNKRKLFVTDGTPAGTVPVAQGATVPSEPRDMLVFAGALFFTAETTTTGRELFRYDGANLTQITGFGIGAYFGAGSELTAVGGQLFFVDGDASNSQLVVSDGTGLGTQQVSNVLAGNFQHPIQNLTAMGNGRLLFSGISSTGNAALWTVDPATLNATMIAELDGFSGTQASYPSAPIRVGKHAYIAAESAQGRGLWRIQADLSFAEVVPGAQLDLQLDPTYYELAAGAVLFMMGAAAGLGAEPYVYEGLTDSVLLLGDLSPGAPGTVVYAQQLFHGELYFVAETIQMGGVSEVALWKTDGTAAGTVKVHDAAPSKVLELLGDRLAFMNTDAVNGTELWSTDGTPGGAALVVDLTPGSASSTVRLPLGAGDLMYFVLKESVLGGTLYATDGTAMGTTALGPQGGASALDFDATRAPVVWQDTLFIALDDGVHGDELWASQGTPATTQMVIDWTPGAGETDLAHLTASADGVFYSVDNALGMGEVLRTDGTAAGTLQVSDLTAQTGGGFIHGIADSVDGVLFTLTNGFGMGEVRVFDGVGLNTLCNSATSWSASDPSWMEPLAGGLLIAGSSFNALGLEPVFVPLAKKRVESIETGSTLGHLTANAPSLGQLLQVQSVGAPSITLSVLAYSPAAAWPAPVAALADGLLWLDPAHVAIASMFTGSNWIYPSVVPTSPSLFGKSVMVQSLYLDPLGYPGELSNALLLTIGL